MDKSKVLRIVSVILIAAGVGAAYFGGVSESGIVAMVGVIFGVVAAVVAWIRG